MVVSIYQFGRVEFDLVGEFFGKFVLGENFIESYFVYMFCVMVVNYGFCFVIWVCQGGQWIICIYVEIGCCVVGFVWVFVIFGLFIEDGLQCGDCIFLFVGNCLEWIEVDFVGMMIGVILVLIYLMLIFDQIVYIVIDVGVCVIIMVGFKEFDCIFEVCDQMFGFEMVILINLVDQVGDYDGLMVLFLEQVCQVGVLEEIQMVVEECMGQLCFDDVVVLIYILGIMGEFKGVMISYWVVLVELQVFDVFFDVILVDYLLSFLLFLYVLEWGWLMVVI